MDEYIRKNVELRVDEKLKAMSVMILGFISFNDFKDLVEYEYKLIEKKGLTKSIIDLRKIPVYAPEMPDYINTEWFPRVSKLGMKHIAFIQPESALGKMSMEKAHAVTKEILGVTVANFGDTESGEKWLKSV